MIVPGVPVRAEADFVIQRSDSLMSQKLLSILSSPCVRVILSNAVIEILDHTGIVSIVPVLDTSVIYHNGGR